MVLDMAPDRSWLRSVSDYAATLGVTYPRPGFAGPAHVHRSCRWLGSRGGMCTRCALPERRSPLCPDPWGTIAELLEEVRDINRAAETADAALAGLPLSPARARRALDLLATVVPLNPNVPSSLTTIVVEYPGTAVAEAAAVLRSVVLDLVLILKLHAASDLFLPLLQVARTPPAGADAGPAASPITKSAAEHDAEPDAEHVLSLLPAHEDLTGAAALLLATASPVLEEGGQRLALVTRAAAEECLSAERWTSLAGTAGYAAALEQTQRLAHVLPHVLTLARQTGAPLTELLDAVRHAHA